MDVETHRPEPGSRPRSRTAVWILLGLLLLSFYSILRQHVFYKGDGQGIVQTLSRGETYQPLHYLFFPVAYGPFLLLRSAGLGSYSACVFLSALGTALGTVLAARSLAAADLSLSRSIQAALLVGLNPAIVFFATVVECHGIFFAFAGLSFLAAAAYVRRPSIPRALCLGIATAVSAGVHALGHFLVPLLLFPILASRRPEPRSPRLLGAVLATHAVLYGVIFLVTMGALGETLPLPNRGFVYVDVFVARTRLGALPGVVWHEWIRPLFPLSVVSILVALRSGKRDLLAFGAPLALLLLLALILTVENPERGAYLLPLAVPAAWLCVTRLPAAWNLALIAISGGLAVWEVERHDRPEEYPVYAREVRGALDGRPAALVIGDPWELGPCLTELEGVPFHRMYTIAGARDDQVDLVLGWVEEVVRMEGGRGREVFVTRRCERILEDLEASKSGLRLWSGMRRRFGTSRVGSGGVSMWRLSSP